MIDTRSMTQMEIYETGLEILSREMGAVGMIRFLQMFEKGKGDYSKERHQWLDQLSIEDVIALSKAEQKDGGE